MLIFWLEITYRKAKRVLMLVNDYSKEVEDAKCKKNLHIQL